MAALMLPSVVSACACAALIDCSVLSARWPEIGSAIV
jgi:hypothetical protein